MLDAPVRGIYRQVKNAGVAVPLPGQNFPDPCTAFVDAADVSQNLFLRKPEGTGLLLFMRHAAIQA